MRYLASACCDFFVVRWPIVSLLLLALMANGCGKGGAVKTYKVKRLKQSERVATAMPPAMPSDSAPQDDGPADRDRMLGAIVPHGDVSWFFKMVGPRDAVGEQMENFLALIKSLKFADEKSPPEWTLPEGWSEGAQANSLTHATLEAKSGDGVLVTTVTAAGGDVLANINRWCSQMGLPPKTKDDLAATEQPKNSEIQTFEVAGSQATLVNLVGKMSGGGPMAKSQKPSIAKPSKPAPKKPGQPTWTVPPGWQEAPGSAISIAAYSVVDGDKSVKTTVTSAGGAVLDNINRWRTQLGLPDWSADELSRQTKTVILDGHAGILVEMIGKDSKTGQPSGLNGAMVQIGEQSWFFKMTGDPELAKREKANFEAFVKSVKF